MERIHKTILEKEVIELLRVSDQGRYVDLTFGEGGHSQAILSHGGSVVGVDRDEQALRRYRDSGLEKENPKLQLVHAAMSEFAELTEDYFDGAIADLGVSTRQILSTERGFSFQGEGPLDMRMDSTSHRTLAQVLSQISERDLADALYQYAEIKASRRIAATLLTDFRKEKIRTTADLVKLVPGRHIPGKPHPATQLFMALRMLVNEELQEIESAIPAIFRRLKPGGRFCVITFHSVEDRVVKRQFKKLAGLCICDEYPCGCSKEVYGELILKKPMLPSEEELHSNPRARSAKLRCIEKLPT